MYFLFFVFGICATKGGPRPDLSKFEEDLNITTPDYDYLTTLDMFDLLQGLLMENRTQQIHTNNSLNQTYILTTTEDSSFAIAIMTITIFCTLLNLYTIYIVSASYSNAQTYSAAQTIE